MLTKSHTPFTLSTTHASQHRPQSSCVSSHLQSTSKHPTFTYKRVLVQGRKKVTSAKTSNLNWCENVNSEDAKTLFTRLWPAHWSRGTIRTIGVTGPRFNSHSRLLLLCYSLGALRRRPKMSDRTSEIQADHESNFK